MSPTKDDLNLADLSDEAFTEIVNQDVRQGLNPELTALLRDPVNVERWYDTLCSLKRSVEAQLSANQAERAEKQTEYLALGDNGTHLWKQYLSSALRWRAGAVRFKNGVEDRLAEARRIRQNHRAGNQISSLAIERDEMLREALRYRRAILEHREYVTSHDDDDTVEADEKLWSLIDSGDDSK